MKLRKNGFRDVQFQDEDLDLVERDDQITFETTLDDEDIQQQEELNTYRYDPDFEENEKEWQGVRAEILGLNSDSDETDDSSDEEEEDSDDVILQPAISPLPEAPKAPVVEKSAVVELHVKEVTKKKVGKRERRTPFLFWHRLTARLEQTQ